MWLDSTMITCIDRCTSGFQTAFCHNYHFPPCLLCSAGWGGDHTCGGEVRWWRDDGKVTVFPTIISRRQHQHQLLGPAAASRQWRLVRLSRGAAARIKEPPPDPGLVRCRLGYNQLQVGGVAVAVVAVVAATFCSVSVAPHQPETCSVRAIVRASSS